MNAGKVVSARGSSGGIATLWTYKLCSMEKSLVTQHWIFSELRHIPSNISLAIFNIYVPFNFQEKRECWNSLLYFLATNSLSNIIVVGDLNITMDSKEIKGGVCDRDPML